MAMIDVYQHYFDAQRHAEVQDKVHNLMEQSKRQAMTELKRGRRKKSKQPELNCMSAETELYSEVQAILDDLLGGERSAD
jgi:F0F1-type ATP synthase membrane subunit b/b'